MSEQPKTNISSLMQEQRKFPVPDSFREKAHISSMDQYEEMYKRSLDDPEGFWSELPRIFSGMKSGRK